MFDNFSTFLFDLDGTLLHGSDHHYTECVRRVGEEKFGIENIVVSRGMSLRTFLYRNFPEFSPEKTEDFIDEYRKMIPLVSRDVSFFEDAEKFLAFSKKSQKKIALVTNCSDHELRETRKHIDLESIFPEIIFSNGILPSKPAPDMYLKAAENLCSHPKNCLVFEDSLSGISAGKSANMKVVALNRTGDICKKSGADFIIESFSDIL
jgi:beta-phosphoglucomutase-like phosphatase (HAD superfamily)